MIGCQLKCLCGGVVETLIDGVMYILTDDHKIIFRGICSDCGENVSVERPIVSLIEICPTPDRRKLN